MTQRFAVNLLSVACVLSSFLAPSPSLAAPIKYDFIESDPFDSSGTGNTAKGNVGATQALTDGVDTVNLTTVDILAPQLAPGTFDPTGTILSAANGDGVRTLFGSLANLGVNNPSIGDNDYITKYGPSGESQNFNKDEAWVFEFDKDVRIEELNWGSVDGTDQITVTVEGVATPYILVDGATNDDYADPLNGLVIPAGKDVTLKATHPDYAGISRLDSLTVSVVVPEPASIGLTALGGFAFLARRARREIR